jgi:hypothetical protein
MTTLCPFYMPDSASFRCCENAYLWFSSHNRHRATVSLAPLFRFISLPSVVIYYSFDRTVTSSTYRSSTSDTDDHRLILSTFTSFRLQITSMPSCDLPCTIAGHASSHLTYILYHLIIIIKATPHIRPRHRLRREPYLHGRLSPLSYFQIYVLISFALIMSFINCRHCRSILL